MKFRLQRMGMAGVLGTQFMPQSGELDADTESKLRPVIEETISTYDEGMQQLPWNFLRDNDEGELTHFAFIPDIEWNEERERRFHELAVAEALEEIEPDQLAELEQLSKVRAEASAEPKSLDQIVQEIREWKVTVGLFSQLSKYVSVIKPPA